MDPGTRTGLYWHLLRLDVDGVLDDGLPGGGGGVGVGLDVALGHPELAGAADDAHLPDVAEHLVAAEDGQAAAVVVPRREHEVHLHEQAERLLVRECVGALRAPDLHGRAGARGPGPRGERVVDGRHRAEEGGGGVGRRRLRDADRRRPGPAQHVVEVELEGRHVGGRRCRHGEEEEEGEECGRARHGCCWAAGVRRARRRGGGYGDEERKGRISVGVVGNSGGRWPLFD
jgi:hypothetical protein